MGTIVWPLLAVLLFSCIGPMVESKEISHEDIKDAMLSLVHLMRDNTEKLERHEARDRQTDEQLKKAIALLTKRVSGIDALKSYMVKVEERVAGIEQLIAQRDERERVQMQKTADTLEELQSRLEGWATEVESKLNEGSTRLLDKAPEIVGKLADRIDNLETEMRERTGQLLDKLEKISTAQPQQQQQTETPATAEQSRAIGRVQELLETGLERIGELPRLADTQAMHNESLQAAEQTRQLLSEAINHSSQALESKLGQERKEASLELRDLFGSLQTEVTSGSERVGKELRELGKGQSVMMEMADHVLDTKKRLEHAYKILREVGELVMAQGLNINSTLNARFDGISNDIMDNQNGALANLTIKMEQEMNQVWRQINVMYQQMMESAKALDKLHKQNEAYVNGTTETMDGMEGKVGEITKRMGEVDTNLNYLLGRLSLVTQEFNQIKEGLGAALDNIKASFKEVQQRANDFSPGPHPLPRNYEPLDSSSPEPTAFSVNLPSSRR